jgi:pilus assembly protein CpaE
MMHTEFMAFAGDEHSLNIIRAFADRQGFPAASVQMGGPDIFSQMLQQATAPRLAIIDIDGQADPAAVATQLSGLCGADCKLIGIGTANDVGLYRRIVSAGIIDYLVKPLDGDALSQAYAAALRGGIAKTEAREAKIIVMIGTRGGVGASTIAINAGWLLAHKFKFQCALLDLDLQYGTTALALDLDPGRGLRDVVASPQRVDSLMVASSIVSASEQFSVLAAEESVEDVVPIDGSAITALLKEMRGNFDYVIVDLPRHMLATQKRLLAAAHEIVLIAELSLAGIRDTLRIKNAISTLGNTAGLTLVASRVNPSHPSQVDAASFEKGAQMKIDLSVPEDIKSVTLAANSGKALGAVAGDVPITKSLTMLAAKLSGKDLDAGKAKKSLFGLFSGKATHGKGNAAAPPNRSEKR